jgi:hypothetical protein
MGNGSQTIYQENWAGVLEQWLFLFVMMSIVFLPGILFATLARRYKKRGWLYFFPGLVVGMVALSFAGFTLNRLTDVFSVRNNTNLIIAIMLILSGSIIAVVYFVFKSWIIRKNQG